LPKKYHRPPTSKRRKSKKSVSYDFIPAPDTTTVDTTAVGLEEPPAPRQAPETREREDRPERIRPSGRQAVRDYSYVRDEVVRIAALTAMVLAVLIIAGILR
jgi:hypothetical protein